MASSMSNPNCSLLALPQEVMDSITLHIDRQDLSNLSMTCKIIRMKTLEILYSKITMIWKGNALTKSYGGYFETMVSPRIDLLLRTILETPKVKVLEKKPSYTRWISTIHLLAEGFEKNQISFTPSLPEQSPSVGEVLREVMQNMDPTWSDIVHAAISEVSLDAFIALFLGSCTNLKSITLGFSLVKNNSFIARIWSYPPMGACFDSPFRKITFLNMGALPYDGQERPQSHPRRLSFMNRSPIGLPTYLEIFTVTVLEEAEIFIPDRSFDSQFAQCSKPGYGNAVALAKLRVRETPAPPKALKEILKRTPNLQRLEYDYWIQAFGVLSGLNLSTCLDPVRHTLAHLTVGLTPWVMDLHIDETENEWTQGSCPLTAFPALRSIEISPSVLLGWSVSKAPALSEVLPPNLVSLTFRDDCSDHYEDFEWSDKALTRTIADFVTDKAWMKSTPHLKQLGLLLRLFQRYPEDEPYWASGGSEKNLRTLCEENDLHCEVTIRDIYQ